MKTYSTCVSQLDLCFQAVLSFRSVTEINITRKWFAQLLALQSNFMTCSSSSFGFFRLGVATADNLHFYNMAFLFLRLDAFPATNPLLRGKTGPPVFYIKVEK